MTRQTSGNEVRDGDLEVTGTLTAGTVSSPALTGTPTAPTASVGTDSTQIATTEFVNSEIANDAVPKSVFTDKGSLLAASAASTPANLPVGTDGQVLKANSATATGLEWAADEGIPNSTISAKGALITGSAASTPATLTVGADGHILTASSGETTGIKWAAPVLTLEDFLLNTDSTQWSLPSLIGRAAFGGFIAGVIDTNQAGSILAEDDYQVGLRYLLIVAPLSVESSTTLAWRTSTATVSGASTRWNGLAAQNALASATYPAFDYCDGLSFPSDGGSKWYLPALDELELCYRNFKPTTDANFDGTRTTDVFPAANFENGLNNASDPQGSDYTSSVPAQTGVSAFQSGGAEAFAADSYWSASWRGSTTAWVQRFDTGSQSTGTQTFAVRVRPVRRVVL